MKRVKEEGPDLVVRGFGQEDSLVHPPVRTFQIKGYKYFDVPDNRGPMTQFVKGNTLMLTSGNLKDKPKFGDARKSTPAEVKRNMDHVTESPLTNAVTLREGLQLGQPTSARNVWKWDTPQDTSCLGQSNTQ